MEQVGREEMEFDIHRYLQLIGRRKWIIVGFTGLLSAAVAVGTAYQPKIYEATTSVLAGNEAPRLLNFSDPLPQERFGDQTYLQTQGAILTSRTFLQGVVKRLMDENFYGKVSPGEREKRIQTAVAGLKPRVRVDLSPTSRVMEIVVSGIEPARIVKLSDTIAEEYVRSNLRNREEVADEAVTWLESQIKDQKMKLDAAEKALQTFKDKENIVGEGDDPLAAIGVSRLQDDYLTTRFQRQEKEARLEALKNSGRPSAGPAESPSAREALDHEVQSAFRDQLKKDYVATQLQYRDLSEKYGPDHPDIVALKDKMSRLAKQLESLETQEPKAGPAETGTAPEKVEDLRAEYTFLLNKEKFLARQLDSRQEEARKLSRTAVQFSLLKQEVEQSRQIFNDLMKRKDEAKLSSQIKNSSVVILDRAVPPKIPVRPKPFQNLMLALILGPMASIGLVIMVELLDRRVKTPQDASRFLQLPVLTVVPGSSVGKKKKKGKAPAAKPDDKMPLVTLHEPRSHAAECYRNLRTSILFSSGRPVPKSILVTSAVAGEGKSTTAANLAVVMAQSGLKTLLIDADLRRPAQQRYFARDPKRGIIRLLTEGARVEEAVQESGIQNLGLLLCNSIPKNPSEILGAERTRTVMEELASKYDVVIIDSPIVVSVPDALILASRAAAVVLVHRPGTSQRELVLHARLKLDEVNANILGLILNDVNVRSSGYLYPEYAYYGYGAEETEEGKKARKRKA
jgi:polysaccharide biosynthesis transport protein